MLKGFPQLHAAAPLPTIVVADESKPTGAVLRTDFPPIRKVVIDGHCVLRIVKHAKDAAPRASFGKLLGVQLGDVVEVTNVVPTVQTPIWGSGLTEEQRDRKDKEDETALVSHMARAGCDSIVAGRYCSSSHATWFSMRNAHAFQEAVNDGNPALLIVYDPQRTAMGKLYLRAIAPSDSYLSYLQAVKAGTGPKAAEQLQKFRTETTGVFRDVPVEIYNSTLASLVLGGLAAVPRGVTNRVVAQGELGSYTERSMKLMVEALDKLRNDVNYRGREDRDAEAAGPKIETMLLTQQIVEHADHIAAVAGGVGVHLDFARQLGASSA